MTITEPELWALLSLIIGVLLGVAIVIAARFYHAVTDVPEVNDSKHLQLYFKLMFTALLAPSIVGLGICVIKTLSLN